MWEIRKGGKAYAHGAGPHGYSPTVLRDMAKTGYTLYIDGKRQKKPPLEAQLQRRRRKNIHLNCTKNERSCKHGNVSKIATGNGARRLFGAV